MNSFIVFSIDAIKPKGKGRPSGGTLVAIRKSIAQFFTKIDSSYTYGLTFKVNEMIHGEPTIYISTYLPPFGSSVYGENDNGVEILDEEILKLTQIYPDHSFLITGDLNARTRSDSDYLIDDRNIHIPLPDMYQEDCFQIERKSRDLHAEVNNHGKALLNLCCSHGIHILNGRVKGDLEGHLTCFTNNGASLVDYTLASTSIFKSIDYFEISKEDRFTHLPQTYQIAIPVQLCLHRSNPTTHPSCCTKRKSRKKYRIRQKYQWNNSNSNVLAYKNEYNKKYVSNIRALLERDDIDGAVDALTTMLQNASKECKVNKTNSQNDGSKTSKWWDSEMELLKYKKAKCLRLLRMENNIFALERYRGIRKLYKEKIKEKILAFQRKTNLLIESSKSGSEFWKIIKSLSQVQSCTNKISSEDWEVYFNDLLNSDILLDDSFSYHVQEYVGWHDANCLECRNNLGSNDVNKSISMCEVDEAIKDTSSSKAPGLDGITNQILKKASFILVPILCDMFNKILNTGTYPSAWGEAIIVPIHKKGDKTNPNNYRGIALLSCISKIFMKIINKRLVQWADTEDKIREEQAGFTKGKSTIDQIFIFQSLVSKYLSKKKGRFYCVYVDFTKAFDNVPHSHLFYSLLTGGLHGKVINVIRNMYSKLYSCVQSSDGILCDSFVCKKGTRQGCLLSPFMFIFCLNELVELCSTNTCNKVFIDQEHSVNMLLYADDIVLFGDTVFNVQKLLNVLCEFCNRWGMNVNLDKTKCMIFRNGGIIKSNEKFYFKGNRLEAVPYYKYLGLVVSSRLNWHQAQTTLSNQATKSLHCINSLLLDYDTSYSTCSTLFNKCALPVLTYGSEIWGSKVYHEIEAVLIKFCRKQLGVGTKTPTPAVLGECGVFSVHTECKIKCIKYWLKLLSQPQDSLLRSCYNMLYTQCNQGRLNWATSIRTLLYSYGFGYIWESQTAGSDFLTCFKERLFDSEIQNWRSSVVNMPKLCTYSLFKTDLKVELYLLLDIPREVKKALAKFRVGNHDLEIEKGRFVKTARENRVCKLCGNGKIEDEYHVLFECSVYNDIRRAYIDVPNRNMYFFCLLLSSINNSRVHRLARFVYFMFKIRSELM